MFLEEKGKSIVLIEIYINYSSMFNLMSENITLTIPFNYTFLNITCILCTVDF